VHDRELKKGDRNRTTLAVARRLVAYMLAVDKKQTDFTLPAKMQAA
jgi:transposase